MRTIAMFFLAAALTTGSVTGATVVVNGEVDISGLSVESLERIYLGKMTLWESGQRITPVMVTETSDVSKSFLEEILQKSVNQYRAYWKKRLFSGGGTVPKTFRSSKEVLDFVMKTPGAIGVVESAPQDGSVRVIQVTR